MRLETKVSKINTFIFVLIFLYELLYIYHNNLTWSVSDFIVSQNNKIQFSFHFIGLKIQILLNKQYKKALIEGFYNLF
jgi:hypothetical protein